MKATSLLSALALLAAVLAALPAAQATELPPPCQTATGSCCGIEPAFAPCCSLLSCPPQPHCPAVRVHTSDFLAYLGPHAALDVYSDCSVQECNDLTGSCCTLDGVASACGVVDLCLPPLTSATAIPLPGVTFTVNPDCTVTVTETYDCPNGFWDTTSYLTVGPIHFVLDGCAPMCACMPIEVDALPQVLG